MLNDPKLLESYRKGEKEAFLILYKKYSNPLRKFLQGGFSFSSQGKICRFKGADSAMDVNAIVQETFTRAFIPSTRKNYDGYRPFQTYLFSIAKNLVLRECYQRERMVNVDQIENTLEAKGSSIFSNKDSYSFNPEQHMQNMELKKITEDFYNSLNDEEQSFFTARFADGNTQEKSAEIMGITRARIKLLEKNIRKRFLDLMRKNGYLVEHKINPRWKRKTKLQAAAA